MSEKDAVQQQLKTLALKPGEKFTHYKRGGVYEIVTLAVQEDTLDPLVVYRSLQEGGVWTRTYANFTEQIEHEGKSVSRFQKLDKD